MAIRPFTDLLVTLRYGELLEELSQALNDLTNACAETGSKGALTLTLKLRPSKGGAIEISDEVKVKKPSFERGSTLMFPTPEGNLQREDPRQLQINGLREIPAREDDELREVSQA